MANFKMLIQYDGGRYKGWQRLGQGENTVQAKIESVLSELCGVPVEITGCGRTDAGVHALMQVASFKTDAKITARELKAYLARYLPRDISVYDVCEAAEGFHARYNAKAKTYLYKIWNREYPDPFLRKYSAHVPQRLDIALMRKAAAAFVGEHDFTAFSNAKIKKKSPVRTLYSVTVTEKEGLIEIRLRGDGFLYNMARKIAGAVIAAGEGELSPEKIPDIIASSDRARAPFLAEAEGLFLESVEY